MPDTEPVGTNIIYRMELHVFLLQLCIFLFKANFVDPQTNLSLKKIMEFIRK